MVLPEGRAPETAPAPPASRRRASRRPSLPRAWTLVQRNMLVYRHTFMVIFSGFFEPVFYLLAIGLGIGSMIGDLGGAAGSIPYAAFVAPAMLATSCLNGAVTEGYFNPFFKLHYQGTYDAVLATPLSVSDVVAGELIWAQIRGSLYSAAFLAVMVAMGLVMSPWGWLALPAAVLVSLIYSAGALFLMTLSRTTDDFDKVMNLLVHPMFLFSATFFPLSVYPEGLQAVVRLTPLYHGVELLRGLTTGRVGPAMFVHLAYLAILGWVCVALATRRLERRLIK